MCPSKHVPNYWNSRTEVSCRWSTGVLELKFRVDFQEKYGLPNTEFVITCEFSSTKGNHMNPWSTKIPPIYAAENTFREILTKFQITHAWQDIWPRAIYISPQDLSFLTHMCISSVSPSLWQSTTSSLSTRWVVDVMSTFYNDVNNEIQTKWGFLPGKGSDLEIKSKKGDVSFPRNFTEILSLCLSQYTSYFSLVRSNRDPLVNLPWHFEEKRKYWVFEGVGDEAIYQEEASSVGHHATSQEPRPHHHLSSQWCRRTINHSLGNHHHTMIMCDVIHCRAQSSSSHSRQSGCDKAVYNNDNIDEWGQMCGTFILIQRWLVYNMAGKAMAFRSHLIRQRCPFIMHPLPEWECMIRTDLFVLPARISHDRD